MYLFSVERGATPKLGPWPDNPTFNDKDPGDRSGFAAKNELMYWRKANQIHRWFIEHCASGVDDCRPVFVHSEALPDLYDRCQRVLADHSLAPELLPPMQGFFFGTYEYDDWYFDNVLETRNMIEQKIMFNPDLVGRDLYYEASW